MLYSRSLFTYVLWCPTLCDPIHGLSRQEYWSGLPFPSSEVVGYVSQPFQIVVLKKTLESPLDSQEIKPSQS